MISDENVYPQSSSQWLLGKLYKSTNIIPRTQIQIQIHITRAKLAWSYHNYYSKAKPYIVGHEHNIIHVCMLYIHNNKIYMCTDSEIHGNSIQPLKQD